ncbi:hypothetical protein BDR04DRAFT_266901 [Suillus decipiens]|nr:hypothetical protein BDR04DRAFT_266901 [Suillus decipiens]
MDNTLTYTKVVCRCIIPYLAPEHGCQLSAYHRNYICSDLGHHTGVTYPMSCHTYRAVIVDLRYICRDGSCV